MVHRDLKVLKVVLEPKDIKVTKVIEVRLLKDLVVLQEHLLKEHRVQEVIQEQIIQVRQVLVVQPTLVHRDLVVIKDLQVPRVSKV